MARNNYNFDSLFPQTYTNPNYDVDDDDLEDDPSDQFDQAQVDSAAANQAADSMVNYEPAPNVLPGEGAPPVDQLEQEVPVNTGGDTGTIEEALNEDTTDDPGDLDALGTLDDNGPGTDEEMPLDAGAADGAAPGPTGDTTTVDETEEEPDQVNEEDILFDDSMGNIDETVFDDTEIGVEGSGLDDLNLDLDNNTSDDGMLEDEGFDNPYLTGEEVEELAEAGVSTQEDYELYNAGEDYYNTNEEGPTYGSLGEGGNIEESAEEQAQTFRELLEENLMAKMMEDAQSAGQRDAGRAIAAARAQAGRGQMGMSGGMIAAQSDAVSNAVANAEDRLFNQQMQAGRLGAGMETEDRNQLITAIGVAEDLGMDDDKLRSFIEQIFPDMDPDLIQGFGLGSTDNELPNLPSEQGDWLEENVTTTISVSDAEDMNLEAIHAVIQGDPPNDKLISYFQDEEGNFYRTEEDANGAELMSTDDDSDGMSFMDFLGNKWNSFFD